MREETNTGASETSHSIGSAAQVIEGLLSPAPKQKAGENSEARETQPETPDEEQPVVEEGEEDEQQPAQDDDADVAEEQPEDEPVQPRKVKVNDEIGEVTEEELVRGYLRQSDYTRKTQASAEARKKAESEAEAVRAERAEIAKRLTDLREAMESSTPAEPDWDALQTEMEPAEFAALYARWDQHKKRIEAVKAQEREAHEKVQRDQMSMFAQHVESEKAKLIEAIPEWKKPEVAKAEKDALVHYATETLGFTEADLASVTDHRVLVMLRNAYLYHKVQNARPKAQEKIEKVKVAAPGTATAPKSKTVAEVTRRKQRLAKTGSVADAAKAIEMML